MWVMGQLHTPGRWNWTRAAILLALPLRAQEPGVPEKALAAKATFHSLQETLAAVGAIDHTFHYRDDKTGAHWTANFGMRFYNVQADASACRLDYDSQHILNGHPDPSQHMWILFHLPWRVSVTSAELAAKEEDARAGRPQWTAEVDPPTFLVMLQGPGHAALPFKSEAQAQRAAELLSSALELCGGGEPPEPGLGPIQARAEELRAAMQYLEAQLSSYGPVNYLAWGRGARRDQAHALTYATEITRFHADPQACTIGFHNRVSWDGKLMMDGEISVHLRFVEKITVDTQAVHLKRTARDRQRFDGDFLVEPDVFVVALMTKDDEVSFRTYEKDLAYRLFRVFTHAVELCGGGGPPAVL